MRFTVHFAQIHAEFRLEGTFTHSFDSTKELKSCAIVEDIAVDFSSAIHDLDSPFMTIELDTVDDARRLIRRAILTKRITLHLADAPTLPLLLEDVRYLPVERTAPYEHLSFKFHVEGFNKSISQVEQVEIIEQFAFMDCKGDVDLKNAEVMFVYDEDWIIQTTESPRRVYFGVHVGWSGRESMHRYNLKKREYLGTTSMDPELSLVMANMGLVKQGSLVLDPFVGTGSVLLSCSHFGAYAMGADIDGRQIRGKAAISAGAKEDKMPPMRSAEKRKQFKRDKSLMLANAKRSIKHNVKQYGFEGTVLDTVVCDIACHPWRECELWDAIICDPPYGIRAGARKIGQAEIGQVESASIVSEQVTHQGDPKYPTTVAYEMDSVIVDLLAFAAKFLVQGGRLVYWLPTITGEYEPQDIPGHPMLRIVANSDQDFGKWSRRLVTMEKCARGDESDEEVDQRTEPAHRNFRKKLNVVQAGMRKVAV